MNKSRLMQAAAEESGLIPSQVEKALDAVVAVTASAVKSGDVVKLRGFGKFTVSERKGRKGRNPQTGEEIYIEASRSVKFTPFSELKQFVNEEE